MRYEDLVAEPSIELKAIAAFLDIPYSDAMVNYHAGKTRQKPSLSAKSAWLPPVKNLRNWEKDMSPEDIGVFEGIAGALLRENDYRCADIPSSDVISTRVRHCLAWWDSEGKK